MTLVETILPVARERLVTIGDHAPLTEAAKFLDGRHINLVVVCDKARRHGGYHHQNRCCSPDKPVFGLWLHRLTRRR